MATRRSKKKHSKIFNDRGRKIFRSNISLGEVGFSVFFIFLILLMGVWFASREDEFDPSERDISIEVLIAQSVQDHLYEPPLKQWVDPETATLTGVAAGPDLGLFPPSLIDGGWTASRIQEFDNSNLYEKINGQEDQYKQFGFQHLYFISISKPSDDLELNLELYDMDTFSNALGIFAAQRSEGSRVDNESRAFYYLTEVGVLGILDNYYFKLTANQGGEVIRAKAIGFVQDFDPGISGQNQTPDSMLILADGLNVPFQNIEYVREDVFQYDFAQDFWFGKPDASGGSRYYLHEAANEAEAAALFEQIRAENEDYDFEEVQRDGNNVIMKHEFLRVLTLNQRGPFVFGVDGSEDPDAARLSLQPLLDLLEKRQLENTTLLEQ